MEQSIRTQVILAAINAVGPQVGNLALKSEWDAAVEQKAVSIALLTKADSAIAKAIDIIETCSVYTATIISVNKEESSTRAIARLKTKPSTNYPDGIEPIRTERTDNPSGLAMARLMRSLIGHKVVIWKEIQKYDGGTGRIVRHVEDKGLDPELAQAPAA